MLSEIEVPVGNAVHFAEDKLSAIRHFTSLPHEPIDSCEEGQSWWAVEVIPFESLGYEVKALDRVYFAGLTKKGLKRGEWRFLSEGETNLLKMGAYL